MSDTVKIIARAKHRDRFSTDWVKSSRTPFLSTARALAAEGYPDDTRLECYNAASEYPSFISTVGVMKGLSVSETNKVSPRFVKFSDFPALRPVTARFRGWLVGGRYYLRQKRLWEALK